MAEQLSNTDLLKTDITDFSDHTIISITTDGIITGWNDVAEATLGYSQEEAIGRHISLIVPPDKREEEESILQHILRGEAVQQFQTARITKAGHRIVYALSVVPVKNSNGEVTGASRIGKDITDQILIEDRRAVLAAIVNSSDDAIVSKNLHGYVTSWNRGAERIFGYTEGEMIGKHITTIIPEDRRYEEDIIISKVRSGERIEHYETIRRRKDGTPVHVSLTVSPVRNAGNEIIGVSKIARNITEHKLASEKVARLAAIVDSSDDAIISKNLQGFITSWNHSAERIFGYNEAEAIGRHITLIIPERLRAEEDMIITAVKSGRRVEHFETRRVRKDGTEVDLSITVSPVKNEKGEIIGASKVARDIADTVKARQQLQLYAEGLQKLNQYKDDFISVASHELNTPLTSLKVYLDMMKMSLNAEKKEQPALFNYVEKAISVNGKLIKLVKDLLDVTRIEAGKLQLQMEQFDLQQLVQDTVESMQVTSRKHKILYEPAVGPVLLAGDKDRLEQVFVNLLSNAVKYSPGADTVIVGTKRDDSHVYVSIQDFGIGIRAAETDHIFSRFYRAEGMEKAFSGLGIGLYISHEIVRGHGGTISLSSVEGEGSLFTVILPLTQ